MQFDSYLTPQRRNGMGNVEIWVGVVGGASYGGIHSVARLGATAVCSPSRAFADLAKGRAPQAVGKLIRLKLWRAAIRYVDRRSIPSCFRVRAPIDDCCDCECDAWRWHFASVCVRKNPCFHSAVHSSTRRRVAVGVRCHGCLGVAAVCAEFEPCLSNRRVHQLLDIADSRRCW